MVNKPPGLSTHSPSPYAGEGLYEWLRHREPRWATLAIVHRLDKETSGLIVFAKTTPANRSLTRQFTQRAVHKKYLLLTDRSMPQPQLTVKTALVRAGEKYLARPVHAGGEVAETHFQGPPSPLASNDVATLSRGNRSLQVVAAPLTGRTHQIRVHAAHCGFPILGDALYGGSPAGRVCLHAAELSFRHPVSCENVTFTAPVDFESDPKAALRSAFIDPQLTNACRLRHGGSDGKPGWYVDRFADFLLSEGEQALADTDTAEFKKLLKTVGALGGYHKSLRRRVRQTAPTDAAPQRAIGEAAPESIAVVENGVRYEISFKEGYSVGLFLDQRDNRRRLLTAHVAAGFELPFINAGSNEPAGGIENPRRAPSTLLNTFAYTCGFSVCGARAGLRTTSLDLSKKYLEWGKRNFVLNGLDPASHDFIFGDVFDWLKRLAKKARTFDVIILDPPTFSQSRASGVFRAQKDYGKLVAATLPLLKSNGVLFASTNTADWAAEDFLASVERPIASSGRKIRQKHYVPQPIDFPISRFEPAHLKTVWLRID